MLSTVPGSHWGSGNTGQGGANVPRHTRRKIKSCAMASYINGKNRNPHGHSHRDRACPPLCVNAVRLLQHLPSPLPHSPPPLPTPEELCPSRAFFRAVIASALSSEAGKSAFAHWRLCSRGRRVGLRICINKHSKLGSQCSPHFPILPFPGLGKELGSLLGPFCSCRELSLGLFLGVCHLGGGASLGGPDKSWL